MTAEQRRAASPRASAWVTASAGTGKTTVLIDRLLRLLLAGTRPERILCLTFTRAAAAEMANRINQRLSRWATLDDAMLADTVQDLTGDKPGAADLGRARALFAHVLDAPGGLRIETIHAFCQSVLRRFPVEAGVTPQFQIADERRQQELLATARARTLVEARHGADETLAEALAIVSANVAEKDFDRLMVSLTAARSRLGGFLRAHDGLDGALGAVGTALGLAPGETISDTLDMFSSDAAFDGKALRQAVEVFGAGNATERKWASAAADWLAADPTARARTARNYVGAFLTQAGAPLARLPGKKIDADHPKAAAAFLDERRRVLALQERLKGASVAETTGALLRLGARLLDHYEREKARIGALDYDDQIERTRGLLTQPGMAAWVLFKLDGGLDHVLVDKAQDTSPSQWDIIESLSAEYFAGAEERAVMRTLFAVGDEKQSIFSFQGADPYALGAKRHLFRDRAHDAGLPWEDVPLSLSFRSAAPVLQVVDATFASADAARGVAIGGEGITHEAHRAGHAGLVELWPTELPREDGEDKTAWAPPIAREPADNPEVRLARRIATKIGVWLSSQTPEASDAWLPARGRRIRPGDIMIVVRSRRTLVDHLVSALKAHDIPVAGIDRMVLSDQLPVMDLMALGDFVLLPEDDLTLAVVLKTPLIGLSEDELYDLAYGRGDTSLWQCLRERCDERPAFRNAHDALSTLLGRVDFVPPYEFFADVLSARGGRAALIRRLGIEINDPIDEFLALALDYQNTHPPSMQGFLQWVRTGRAEIKRDLEHGAGEVRILTAHGAKGLQAPVVFLPDTTRLPRHAPDLLWLSQEDHDIPLWPGPKRRDSDITARARTEDAGRQNEEYRRLLYVAMTRAEDRLYVCGDESAKGRAEGCWYDLIADGIAKFESDPAFRREGDVMRLEASQAADPETEPAADVPWEPLEPLEAALHSPAPPEPEPSRPLAPSRAFAETPAVDSPLAADGGEALHHGRIVHRLLELLPAVPPATQAETARQWLGRPGFGLSLETQVALLEQVMAVLQNPALADLFGPASLAEVPITAVVGDRVLSGQIDRLLVEPDVITVVDFKTGRSPPARDSGVPAAYLRQMAAYRAALEQALADREIRCGLLYTTGPRLIWLSAETLDRHAP